MKGTPHGNTLLKSTSWEGVRMNPFCTFMASIWGRVIRVVAGAALIGWDICWDCRVRLGSLSR